jgi:hypothetical protein
VWTTEAAEGTQGNSRELKGTHQKTRGNSRELTKYKVPKGPRIRVKTRGKATKGSRGNSGNSPFGVHLVCRTGGGQAGDHGRAKWSPNHVGQPFGTTIWDSGQTHWAALGGEHGCGPQRRPRELKGTQGNSRELTKKFEGTHGNSPSIKSRRDRAYALKHEEN